MAESDEFYDGPVCYVGQAEAHTISGELADPGWHYTAVVDEERKDLAIAHAKAEVAVWEKRAAKPLLGTFAREQLQIARASLQSIEDASWEVPGEKLTMDAKSGRYKLAGDGDKSHHAKHHKRYTTIALGGNIGIPETPEAVEAALRHLDEFEERLAERGLDPHEADHIYTRPDEIAHLRRYLEANRQGVRR